jgi:hypothetical protein
LIKTFFFYENRCFYEEIQIENCVPILYFLYRHSRIKRNFKETKGAKMGQKSLVGGTVFGEDRRHSP